jgi:hypothetical protein
LYFRKATQEIFSELDETKTEPCIFSGHQTKTEGESEGDQGAMMTHKYRGSQQSSREVKLKFIDSTQGEPKNIYKP